MMREISQAGISAVSGAGLTDFLGEVNAALTQVSSLFDTTVETLKGSTDNAEKTGLSYKAFSLSIAQVCLLSFSGFLTKLIA
ncbi:hypothetical protein [Pantoea sp. KPR_PJ]|uniref:hypothetical protein n=1 Tax=Pantoea sp. KPR_PJ TaxID=2738375 RepID=UPI003527D242